jgi:hypothetical protein
MGTGLTPRSIRRVATARTFFDEFGRLAVTTIGVTRENPGTTPPVIVLGSPRKLPAARIAKGVGSISGT